MFKKLEYSKNVEIKILFLLLLIFIFIIIGCSNHDYLKPTLKQENKASDVDKLAMSSQEPDVEPGYEDKNKDQNENGENGNINIKSSDSELKNQGQKKTVLSNSDGATPVYLKNQNKPTLKSTQKHSTKIIKKTKSTQKHSTKIIKKTGIIAKKVESLLLKDLNYKHI